MFSRILCLMLFLVGCATPAQIVQGKKILRPTQVLYVDPTFTESERLELNKGAAGWEKKTKGCVRLGLDYESPIPPASEYPAVVRRSLSEKQGGRTIKDVGELTIILNPKNVPRVLDVAFAHELGHSFNIKHQRSGLMCSPETGCDPYKEMNGVPEPDEVTLREFYREHPECQA